MTRDYIIAKRPLFNCQTVPAFGAVEQATTRRVEKLLWSGEFVSGAEIIGENSHLFSPYSTVRVVFFSELGSGQGHAGALYTDAGTSGKPWRIYKG